MFSVISQVAALQNDLLIKREPIVANISGKAMYTNSKSAKPKVQNLKEDL